MAGDAPRSGTDNGHRRAHAHVLLQRWPLSNLPPVSRSDTNPLPFRSEVKGVVTRLGDLDLVAAGSPGSEERGSNTQLGPREIDQMFLHR